MFWVIVRVFWVISSVLGGLRVCWVVSRTFWVNTNVLGDCEGVLGNY